MKKMKPALPTYSSIVSISKSKMSSVLFTLANGAELHSIPASELLKIPVWKNNRIIDHAHVANIQRDVGNAVNTLDYNYHVAILNEEDAGGHPIEVKYIIDGQHRYTVLKRHFETNLCVPDFPVLVFQRRFASEGELIEYFNTLNNSKPVQPWIDENLILNNYVRAMEEVFVNRRVSYIRGAGCHRPYLSAERLREALRNHLKELPATEQGARTFAETAKTWNDEVAADGTYLLGIRGDKKKNCFEKGMKVGFVLAYDDKFKWIEAVLKRMTAT